MSETDEYRDRMRLQFGAAADAYQRARPGYADAAIDWLLPAGVERVLDLAAGTGTAHRLTG
jgi:hypothetical protein